MTKKVLLALPSKGRLMEKTQDLFMEAGLPVLRGEAIREYKAVIPEIPNLEVVFLSAQDIVYALRDGTVDIGISGEDLMHEALDDQENFFCKVALRLGFGFTDVVVAVPRCWLDVASMADLEDIAMTFYARHGRRLKVATKYHNLTRRWFSKMGVSAYRIVESLGATEGTPASGTAEVVVDITTTGATLRANGLKILDNGLILKSQAALLVRLSMAEDPLICQIVDRLRAVLPSSSSEDDVFSHALAS